jgi:hypothetical protein
MLERLAEADAFHGLNLDRRQALWAVKGLADTVLPLFAAADHAQRPRPELVEPPVPLAPMRAGAEVARITGSRHNLYEIVRYAARAMNAEGTSRRRPCCWPRRSPRSARYVPSPGARHG